MYEITTITDGLKGVVGSETPAEAQPANELIELLGLEGFLAISGVEVSLLTGLTLAEARDLLRQRGIDPDVLDVETLGQLTGVAAAA
jgi:hypothetical protein